MLAVGDEAFQTKCLERVARFQREGRTILFVTHAADLVRRICDRVVVLDHGLLVANATPGEGVRTFREYLRHPIEEAPPAGPEPDAHTEVAAEPGEGGTHGEQMAAKANYRVRITDVEFEHPGTVEGRAWLLPDDSLTIRVRFHATEPTADLNFGIAIHDDEGRLLFGTNTRILGTHVPQADGDGEAAFVFDRVPLLDGTYLVTLAIQTEDEGTVYDWREAEYTFEVMNPERSTGLVHLPVRIKFE